MEFEGDPFFVDGCDDNFVEVSVCSFGFAEGFVLDRDLCYSVEVDVHFVFLFGFTVFHYCVLIICYNIVVVKYILFNIVKLVVVCFIL